MKAVMTTKKIGLTLRCVLDLDEEAARKFREALPGSIIVAGKPLSADDLLIGVDGEEFDVSRIWVCLEELSTEREEDFLAD